MKRYLLAGIFVTLLAIAISGAADTTMSSLLQPPSMASVNTVPVVTAPNTITYEKLPNAAIATPLSVSGFYLTNGTYFYVGPTFQPATLPVVGNFTWANQGTATETANNNALTMGVPAVSSGFPIRYVAYSGAHTLTVAVAIMANYTSFYPRCGIGTYNGTKLTNFAFATTFTENVGIAITSWTNSTTISSTLYTGFGLWSQVSWMQIQDNGSNLIYLISADGANWIQVFSGTYSANDYTGSPGNFYYGCVTDSHTPALETLLSWVIQ